MESRTPIANIMPNVGVKKWNGKHKMESVDILAMNVPLAKLKTYLRELQASTWPSAHVLATEVETAIWLQTGKPPLCEVKPEEYQGLTPDGEL